LYHTSNTTDICQQANSGGIHSRDPGKLSHHVHRIGYHFRSEVVEDACKALEYYPFQDTFLTGEELKQRQHNSIVSKAFARQGLNYDRITGNEETPEQVRAAIKEMFPKIPQHDLDEIVTRAWEAGSDRVGGAKDIPLSRRAQLATLARIRHTYTDYDALLRAFGDWRGTREQVEPICVQKMIEWRGETDGDDEGLEEIIRETIVIDDDDDDDEGGDSSDTGGASDTSIEISHRPAAVEDLRAEEATERDHRYFQRNQVHDRTLAKRNDIARQKINAVRSGEHHRRAHAYNQHDEHRQPQRIYVPSYGRAELPQQIMSGGRIMRLVSIDPLSAWFGKANLKIHRCKTMLPTNAAILRAHTRSLIAQCNRSNAMTCHRYCQLTARYHPPHKLCVRCSTNTMLLTLLRTHPATRIPYARSPVKSLTEDRRSDRLITTKRLLTSRRRKGNTMRDPWLSRK
jgi:hypothetical protein